VRLRLRGLAGCLADYRDCPGSPGMSTPPSPFGAADRTFIRVYLLQFACDLAASAVSKTRLWLSIRLWPAFCCLQNRLSELGENFAIEIREW